MQETKIGESLGQDLTKKIRPYRFDKNTVTTYKILLQEQEYHNLFPH